MTVVINKDKYKNDEEEPGVFDRIPTTDVQEAVTPARSVGKGDEKAISTDKIVCIKLWVKPLNLQTVLNDVRLYAIS